MAHGSDQDNAPWPAFVDLMAGILFVFVLLAIMTAIQIQDAPPGIPEPVHQQVVQEADRLRVENAQIRSLLGHWQAHATDLSTRLETSLQVLESARTEAEETRNRAVRLEAESQALRRRLQEMEDQRKDPQLLAALERLRQAQQARAHLLRRMGILMRDAGVPVEISLDDGVLRLDVSSGFFVTNAATLTPEGERRLRSLADTLSAVLSCPDCVQARLALDAIYIEGHADSRPRSGPRDNWDLSVERAAAAYRAILTYRPSLADLRNAQAVHLLGLSGYGSARLLQAGDREEDHARNRRIEVRLLLAPPSAADVDLLQKSLVP